MDVEETPLPGIGVRRELVLDSGRRVGIVIHRDGETELIVSKLDDPDACLASIPLSVQEAATLGSLLGGPQLVAQLSEEHRELPGIRTIQVPLTRGSPFAGRPLGDAHIRSSTGASIVAIARQGEILPSPAPSEELRAEDVLVIVGTDEGLAAAAAILNGS
ncbi:cation:proton antiporter regulatory subunit [Arthrobacter crystallopoietes]|jgi:TrkA domain protein|uniref:cation:proton antiporter regulatory subunit n=1 Tax=Micrococcaceae TaxID=1268 RepID=UPI0021CA4146|nr:cation:proton antiporter regulatory subunit [Arthrobacter sp. Marseille-P9274]